MILQTVENNVKILSICFQKNQDKIWSCKMNSLDQREFSMRSSLKLENSEMRAMLEVIKLLYLIISQQAQPVISQESKIRLNLHKEIF